MAPIIVLLVLSLTASSSTHSTAQPRTLQSFGVQSKHGQPVYPLPANVALGLFNPDPLLDLAYCAEGKVQVYQNLGNGTFGSESVWERQVLGEVEKLEWKTSGHLTASMADPSSFGNLGIHYVDGRDETITHEQIAGRCGHFPADGFGALPPLDPPISFREVWRSPRNSLPSRYVQVGDIDNDANIEVAYALYDSASSMGRLTVFENYGNDQYRIEWDSLMESGTPLAITDVDNNGHKEIIVAYSIPGAGVIGLLECLGEGQFRFYQSNIAFDRPAYKVLQTDVNHDGIPEVTVLTSDPSAPIEKTIIHVAQFSGKGPGPNGWVMSFSPQYLARYQAYTFDMTVGQVDGQGWDEIIPAGGSFGYHEPAPVDYLWYSGVSGPNLWRTREIYTGLQSGTEAVMFVNLDADTTMEFVSGAPGPIGHGSMFALKYQHDTTWSVLWADSSLRNSPLWVNRGMLNGQFVVAGANTWDLSPLDTLYANLNVYEPEGFKIGVWRGDSIYIQQFHLLDIDFDGRTNLIFAQTSNLKGRYVKDFESDSSSTGVGDVGGSPQEFAILQNYPNPFNPTTTIRYSLPSLSLGGAKGRDGEGSLVTLKVFDVLGREVATLLNETRAPEEYVIEWNARDYPSGMYFYRLEADGMTQTRRMLLIR